MNIKLKRNFEYTLRNYKIVEVVKNPKLCHPQQLQLHVITETRCAEVRPILCFP